MDNWAGKRVAEWEVRVLIEVEIEELSSGSLVSAVRHWRRRNG